MTLRERRKRHGESTNEGGIENDGMRVELRMPIEGNDGQTCGWLTFGWTKWDPLVVEVRVLSANRHPIIERPVLRSDVRDALIVPGCLPGLSIGPSASTGFTALVFQEGDITLPVVVPSAPLWDAIRFTEQIVPMSAKSEARALDEAFEKVLGHYRQQPEVDSWTNRS